MDRKAALLNRPVFNTIQTANQTICTYTKIMRPENEVMHVGDPILQAALMSRLQAQANNRANVPLDDVAQGRIIFGIVGRFHLVQTTLLHVAEALLPSRISSFIESLLRSRRLEAFTSMLVHATYP